VARFVYGERVNVPEVMIKGGTTYRLVTDHVGSVRLVVDAATGVVAQRMDYDELGRVLLDTSPGFQPFGFAGGLHDAETRLVRFGARDYDAETGRWTAKDPLLFGGGDTNLYAYALGDPVNNTDPTGRYALAPVLIAAPVVTPAIAVTGIVGLCILMASWLDDATVDVPYADPANGNDCNNEGNLVENKWRAWECRYRCRDGGDLILTANGPNDTCPDLAEWMAGKSAMWRSAYGSEP
jgi:RHS repeat-associated protein